MGYDRDISGDEAHAALLQQLMALVERWREESRNYTGVMYYNNCDKEADEASRARQDNLADELQAVIDGHLYN